MGLNAQMRRDGVVIVQDVFTGEEIERLRGACLPHLQKRGLERDCGKHDPAPIKNFPELNWVYTHPPVVDAIRKVLGEHRIVFTGNADLHLSQFVDWHKDVGEVAEGTFQEDHFANDDFGIYKIGVYLQDHSERRGLTVRLGSHLVRDMTTGEVCYLSTHARDITVMDVRLTHCGQEADWVERGAMWLNGCLGRVGIQSAAGRRVKELYWRFKREEPKLAVFFTYGKLNHFTDDFARVWDSSPTVLED